MTHFLCALLLGISAVMSWNYSAGARAYAQRHLRFAILLYAGLAGAGIVTSVSSSELAHLTLAVGLLVSTLAPPLLAIAVIGTLARPLNSIWTALGLALTTLAAMAVTLTGLAVLALIPQILALVVLTIVALPAPRGICVRLCLAALALAAGMLAIVAETPEAGAILSLFSAAGLLGVTRALVRAGTPSHMVDG